MLDRMTIVSRLLLGFALLLLGAAALGVLGGRDAMRLSAMSSDMFEHSLVVSSEILEVRSNVLLAQTLMTHLVHGVGDEIIALEQLRQCSELVDQHLAVVRERYLGPPGDVQRIEQALYALRAVRVQTLELVHAGRLAEATAHNHGRDSLLAERVLEHVNTVVDFSAAKALSLRDEAAQEGQRTVSTLASIVFLILVCGIALAVLVTRSVGRSLHQASDAVNRLIEGSAEKIRVAEAIAAGDLSSEISFAPPLAMDLTKLPDDESGTLLKTAARLSEVQTALDEALRAMMRALRDSNAASHANDWLKSGLNDLNTHMQGEQGAAELADRTLTYLAEYLGAGVGTLYLYDGVSEELRRTATYAYTGGDAHSERIRLGATLIGQAAAERRTITLLDVPPSHLPITSALGQSTPAQVLAIPLLHDGRLVGAIELGSFQVFSPLQHEFLQRAAKDMAIGLGANLSRQRLAEFLEETQQQTEELRVQQEELQQSNEELEERAQLLEEQRESIRAKNREIGAAADSLRTKAEELEQTSTYKSEFLANMSHELRTPLNSLMILSSLLAQNKDGNLTDKQVEFAATIQSAGKDLLNLINDILDLSKVEAGQMRFDCAEVSVAALCDGLCAQFAPMVAQKGLVLQIDSSPAVPAILQGDAQRIQQVLKNLLSNAVKFTERGEIVLNIALPEAAENPLAVPSIAFAVRDTGIGIASDQQEMVFQAFQQADGSISRKYGGTGLGLSISLQLARGMNGEIRMSSEEGQGSKFTFYLPLLTAEQVGAPDAPATEARAESLVATAGSTTVAALPSLGIAGEGTDRPVMDGEKSILVIEDDAHFSGLLQDMVRQRGFTPFAATDGETGVALAERLAPSAILLDVKLPRLDGWGVMHRLKDNPRTRHIPVHFISCHEERHKAIGMGAIGFATKPIGAEQLYEVFQSIEGALTKSMKRLLIIEDNAVEAKSMIALLDEEGIEIVVAVNGAQALEKITAQHFDCMVLDLGLADMSGFELLERLQAMGDARHTPVIIHSGKDLNHEDERKLRRYAESIIIKGAKSPERLLNEVTLFLHLVERNLHPSKQRMIRTALDTEAMLEGRKVLLVDDDMRNVFSLTSVLAEKHMEVIEAENGHEALVQLEAHPDICLVLMDIMMPEMDGYAAMREIRKNPRHAALPIIAMTAKALKGDQEKCIAAGASDYLAKPIEVDKLLSLIRVWLFQRN
jgi:CheY-like chemotaxis protein